MQKYQAILLDFDNTLYHYYFAHQAGLQAFIQALLIALPISKQEAEHAYTAARDKVQTRLKGTAASHHRLLYMQTLCEQLNLNPANYVLHFSETYWNAFLDNMYLYPKVLEFLQAWRSLDKRIVMVTDLTAQIQYQKIERLQLQKYFDFFVISEEVGFDKPHPHMFHSALEKLQLNKKEVVMIGDHLEKDIYGARAVGIDAWLFSPEQISGINEISVNFEDLLKKL